MVSLKLKDDYRQQLYYNKYRYRAKFNLVGVGRTRYVNSFFEYKQRAENVRFDFPNKDIYLIDFEKIKKFLEWKKLTKGLKKQLLVRVEYNTCIIYTNDTSDFSSINDFATNIEYFQVNDNIPTDVKYFGREPKSKYRVYLKSKRITKEVKETLKELELRYKGTSNEFTYSFSFIRWLTNQWETYLRDNFYINYNDENTYTLLSLLIGDLFRANYKCLKKPNP